MIASYVGDGLTVLLAAGIIFVGLRYLTAPAASATTFGLPEWPAGAALAWLNVKGVRDIASGLIPLALLATGQATALGCFLLVATVIPIGDALTILRYRGSKALAYGMHGGTAAGMVLAGLLLLVP
ncbi:MAG TPA: DUF4267 domain-containing protein [Pseudonocardiaceae bacterium]|jgi:hypothetical protein|nr:DUF4267 domain-containing protein [Pseudonocardiaceae bacterium]